MRFIELSINVRAELVDISATRDLVRAMIVSMRLRDAASRASSIGVVGSPSTITTSTELLHPIVRLFHDVEVQGGIVGSSMGTMTPVGHPRGTTLEVPGFGQFEVVGGGRHHPVLPSAIIQVGGMAIIPPVFHRTGGFGVIVFVGFISVASSGGQYMIELEEIALEEVVFGQFG